MKRLHQWLLASLVVGGLGGCGTPPTTQDRLVGAWRNDIQQPCHALLMRFAADGIGRERDGTPFTYRLYTAHGRPTMDVVYPTETISYGLNFVTNNRLDLYFGDDSDVFTTMYRENEARC